MKNKYLLIVVFVLSVVAILSSRYNSTSFLDEKDDSPLVDLYNPNTKEISSLDLEDYVLGVVAAEMPASFNEEALKAQAIAARTYAFYKLKHTNKEYDLIADVSNQAYITEEEMKEKWQEEFTYYYQKIKKAVDDTKKTIMFYDDEPIIAYYFAMSNGSTEDASLVFGEKTDYLISVDSLWDKDVRNYEVINTISKNEFCQKLNISCDKIIINKINKSSTGRVNTLAINDKVFKGTEVRSLLNLRSTDFEIKISDKVEITTRGYGHGVGMSQYGANEMAKIGYKYDEILKYYYHDIELKSINV